MNPTLFHSMPVFNMIGTPTAKHCRRTPATAPIPIYRISSMSNRPFTLADSSANLEKSKKWFRADLDGQIQRERFWTWMRMGWRRLFRMALFWRNFSRRGVGSALRLSNRDGRANDLAARSFDRVSRAERYRFRPTEIS